MSNPLLPPFYMSHSGMNAERNEKGATWPPSRGRSDRAISDEEAKSLEEKGINIKNRKKQKPDKPYIVIEGYER